MAKGSVEDKFKFLSTPSVRRATTDGHGFACHVDISIHALREEGDFPARPPA